MSFKTIAIYTVIIIAGISLAYGGWLIKKKINYHFEYKSQVQNQIDENLKPMRIEIERLKKEIQELKKIK